ncbi:S-adenosyl-L-methionine-dependent uroporphyrinogen III methyltransferase, chloroplastic, variant 2 [Pleodorina starrii]|uniref:uroporphyrinogen-III C-methyltransferase n=1 Tax=Pleodorina starrii TaxID=330485 RepID=A0A9W6BH74_9CHLO|nr:S-adenosyl-L-methionine-dependent uroporphyrinogen III methyltransferase [Pleodorina starrii]GLC52054.1 S-adenosyl-L-methionine-dependent uroporphyrinogen III methyltransferase, chloroplastic, variant 2 [Pleodorina starrii]GLC72195.1 S-adenosyl-L-methionine-dependent uroporphyrinogen III methyltransferase [Pleodorina starrii]
MTNLLGLQRSAAAASCPASETSTSGRSLNRNTFAPCRVHDATRWSPVTTLHSVTHRAPRGACLVSRSIADGHDANRLKDCNVLELETFLQAYRERNQGPPSSPGEVFLVGTGPGDPGLLTLRAAQLMASADVVLYDRLVSDEILQLVNPAARMVYVGKTAGYHTRRQEEIHELLLAFAEAGALVVRLKGGDPYVFGRGGEEVQYLSSRGIRVHCVPGITAAAGICAELGIPLTHRGVATSARFLTGHSREGGEEALDEAVALAADPYTTLIVYMGLQTLAKLTQQLLAAGMSPDTPAVAVERGTTAARRVVYGTAAELHGLATAAGLRTPTLILLGAVVGLSPGWQDWQEAGRPLEWNEASTYPALQLRLDVDMRPAAASGGGAKAMGAGAEQAQRPLLGGVA